MKLLTGINIQFPISRSILDGSKVVETRTYPIPEAYLGKDLVIVETPGKLGRFKARAVAIVRFGACFQYRTAKEFYDDIDRHQVAPSSPWAWSDERPKWGWTIDEIRPLSTSFEIKKRIGIRYTKDISV
ncbi:MAG: hypothetical protein J0L82_18365 [Deltaproteobacteria bacterium]|nr:hypothetical protein [Deltaproteobacteria bacterium]